MYFQNITPNICLYHHESSNSLQHLKFIVHLNTVDNKETDHVHFEFFFC